MSLTGCTQEEAERALCETNNDTVEAVDRILNIPQSKWAPKTKHLDETQKKFTEMRKVLESSENSIQAGFGAKKTDQRDCSSSLESSHSPCRPLEEPLSDSHRTQQNQITIPELEEQKQETACQ
jgi:hypothetical protein